MSWNDTVYGPTREQLNFVDVLQKRLHISDHELDRLCEERFGTSRDMLSKQQCSGLIEQMLKWKQAPAQLQRERGQLDMFGGQE